jgi:secreted trypsin-like serine protease
MISLYLFRILKLFVFKGTTKISEFSCGGSIISEKFILSAAHCTLPSLIPPNIDLKKVRIGEWDRSKTPDCEVINNVNMCAPKSYDMAISETFSHESYNSNKYGKPNDISLLKLRSKIVFNDFVKPICILGLKFEHSDSS